MTAQQQKQAPKDYTRRFRGGSSGRSASSTTSTTSSSTASSKGHDRVIHHPPFVLLGLGILGGGSGILANLWQFFTTFIALWAMFNVGTKAGDLTLQAFW